MTPTGYSSPLGPNSLFTFSFFPFTSILLSCYVSLPFPLSFTNLFSFSFFGSSSILPVPFRRTLLSLSTSVQYQHTTPPTHNITVTALFTVLIPFLMYNFPVFPSTLFRYLGLPALHVIIYHGVALDCNIYPLPFSISIYYQLLY